MTYATEVIQNYRMALRDLWNGHYWTDVRFRDSQTLRAFKRVELPIFEALVRRRLQPDGKPATAIFGNGFRIAASHGDQIPPLQLIGETSELVPGPLKLPPLELTLIGFFDWAEANWRDFRYYLTRIDAFEGRADLVGRRAIIDVHGADVFWGPK